MATVFEKLTAIADAIRSRTGGDSALSLDDMASGIDEVYEAGEDTIWDKVLNGGTRTNCEQTFSRWNCEYIRPPFVWKPNTRTIECFQLNNKLKKIEKQYFDFSGCPKNQTSTSGHYYTFYYCPNLEVVEDIGLPACSYTGTWHN